MSNLDQQLVDCLYNAIYVQKLRFNYFNGVGTQVKNSVWNKHSDEKLLLDITVHKYKNYYKEKINNMKLELEKTKETNIASYMTYDTEYHINLYNQQVEKLDKYLVELENKTFEQISTEKLSIVCEEIDYLFPNYLVDPTLIGKLL